MHLGGVRMNGGWIDEAQIGYVEYEGFETNRPLCRFHVEIEATMYMELHRIASSPSENHHQRNI